MSSSEPRAAGRRFLAVLFAGAALMLGGVISATALIDPTGLLVGAGWPQGLCAPGIKDPRDIGRLTTNAQVRQPHEIIVGSSRVIHGIDRAALSRHDGARLANLGLSGGTLVDIDAIVRSATAHAPIQTVWIGLDMSAFGLIDPVGGPGSGPATSPSPQQKALFSGLLSPQAWSGTLRVLRSPRSCSHPSFDADGFIFPGASQLRATDRAILPDSAARAQMMGSWKASSLADRDIDYAAGMARFTRLLADLRHQGVAVVLYVGPTHPAYDSLVAEAGLTRFRVRWRADVARIAREQGAVLVPADRSDFLATLPGLPANCDATPADCAFYDATHFRPFVGTAIIREGRRRSGSPTDPR